MSKIKKIIINILIIATICGIGFALGYFLPSIMHSILPSDNCDSQSQLINYDSLVSYDSLASYVNSNDARSALEYGTKY